MSFVQKNRAWLLPVLGAGVVWAFWNMYRAFNPPAVAVARPAAMPLEAGAPAMPPPAIPADPVQPPPQAAAATGLWADLKALEAPPPELSRVAELLKEGEKPLTAAGVQDTPWPDLSPEDWKGLPEPQILRVAHRAGAAAPAAPLPRLDFVIEHQGDRVREAWFGGRGYREGASPDGVHRIKRITDRTVLLGGPSGEALLTTDLGRVVAIPQAETTAAPAEAK